LILLATIALSLCAGLGLLLLCGQRHLKNRLLLAPTFMVAVSGIALSLIVLAGIPIKTASLFIWGAWIALAVYGSFNIKSALQELAHPASLWVSAAATLITLG